MAGSLKYFEYDTDLGDNFAILMDESNGELMGNEDFGDTSAGSYLLPRNVEPRYARYSSVDNNYARNIICSTPAILIAVPDNINVQDGNGGTVQLILRQRVGERLSRIPVGPDSGIDDGDAT